MKKLFSAVLVIIFILTVFPLSAFADEGDEQKEEPFSVQSPVAVIVNADTGTELYGKNADSTFFCGFLPRIMTCIMLVESGLDLQTEIVLTKEMMANTHDKSSADLRSGDKISLYDLMQSAIVANSQEACIAIAVTLAGSVTDFVVDMNLRARDLGAENTTFTNVTGQYSTTSKQVTTAHDIVKICSHILTLDYIEDISNKRYTEITVNGRNRSLYTKNFLVDKNSQYYSKKASGLAISGSNISGYSLVSIAVDKTMRIVCFAMNYDSLSTLYAEMAEMITFSLNEYSYRTLIQKNAPVLEVPVVYGKERDSITLVAEKTLTASMPSSVPDSSIEKELVVPDSVDAPISKGTVLGSVTYSYDGRVYGTTNLIAQTDISLDVVESYSDAINEFFSNKYLLATVATVVVVVVFYSIVLYVMNRKKMKKEQSKKRDRINKMPK